MVGAGQVFRDYSFFDYFHSYKDEKNIFYSTKIQLMIFLVSLRLRPNPLESSRTVF